jgi:anti-sigma regulatory factor (Ser/Thr protein kinase)
VIRVSRITQVAESTDVSAARRMALQMAEPLRLGDTATGRGALITTELATNLVKHGGGGSMLFGFDDGWPESLVIVAMDKGPGIPNVLAAMRDGYSTGGTAGEGLGAVQRSASWFSVYSLPNKGTVVGCAIAGEESGRPPVAALARPPRIAIAGICIAMHGEDESGDAWTALNGRDVITLGVADGLGHGPAAATAARGVVRSIQEQPDNELAQLLEDAHAAVRPTRGAAVGLARIYLQHNRVDFAGIGNIAGSITTDEAHRKVVSMPGIIGHEMRRVQTFSYPWGAASVLVLQSDGVSASWNHSAYPGLFDRDPMMIAAVLYRDYCRGSDDATVVVAKATE